MSQNIYPIWNSFYNEINIFNSVKQPKGPTKERKVTIYDSALERYNEYLEIHFNEYKTFANTKKGELGNKYDPINYFLEQLWCVVFK